MCVDTVNNRAGAGDDNDSFRLPDAADEGDMCIVCENAIFADT